MINMAILIVNVSKGISLNLHLGCLQGSLKFNMKRTSAICIRQEPTPVPKRMYEQIPLQHEHFDCSIIIQEEVKKIHQIILSTEIRPA